MEEKALGHKIVFMRRQYRCGVRGLQGGGGAVEWVGGVVPVGVGPCGQRWTLGWFWGMEWHDGTA